MCHGGEKVNAHAMVVLRHCPQLNYLFLKFSCCYCHGTECGGCERKNSLMTISLPDFKKPTVLSFLELLYTGRTFFTVSIIRMRDDLKFKSFINLETAIFLKVVPFATSRQTTPD